MAGNSYSDDDDQGLMSEINMTPLVDVMLVLLIVFMVTIPVIHHAVSIDLPRASSQREQIKQNTIDLSVAADGSVLWNGAPVDEESLHTKLVAAGDTVPQPELHLNIDRHVVYDKVAQIMSAAQNAGIAKIGFITDPRQQ